MSENFLQIEPRKKPINKETHKQNLRGIVLGLSRDCPALFLRFPGNFVYVFPFFPVKRGNTKQFDPHPFPGQSREVVYVYWFFFRSRPGKPNQRKGQNEKFLNFALFL